MWRVGITITGCMAMLSQPRMWLAMAFFVSQLLLCAPCCCWRGNGAAQSADCCRDSACHLQIINDLTAGVENQNSESPRPHDCRCHKIICAGSKPEAITIVDIEADCFESFAQPISLTGINFGDLRRLVNSSGRMNVVALRGPDCCTVLCRWLC